jgi:RNA polymerase sigma factor (TIGR02999 family)
MSHPTHKITDLLKAWNKGDKQALEDLTVLVEPELHRLAHNYMKRERDGHVLQTTALVNEALAKLIQENISWQNRKQFYAIVARRMRQILVDYVRKQLSVKGGQRAQHVDLSDAESLAVEKSKELIDLDLALEKLAKQDEQKVTIIEYRFFIGLTTAEIAELLETSTATIEREWKFARDWLKVEMTGRLND